MSAAEIHNARPELVERGLLVPVESLHTHPENPRRGDVQAIAGSLERFGQMRAVIANLDGTIVAGNHTYQAAQRLGWTHIAATLIDLTPREEAAYLIADNRHSDVATYDDRLLLEHLQRLGEDDNLAGVGYTLEEITELDEQLAALDEFDPDRLDPEASAEEERGAKLDLLDVSITDPRTQLGRGAYVRLGPHELFCESVFTGWPVWGDSLVERGDGVNVVFCPYPIPTLPLCERLVPDRLVLVQPDPWMAGHVVDKWESVHGAADIHIVRTGL